MAIIGDIRDAEIPKRPISPYKQNVRFHSTPFGQLTISVNHYNKIRWALGPITIQSYKGEVSNAGQLWIGAINTTLFLSITPKIRKRKSRAICPGLDLRPLQQEYRKRLGDLHRLKANKNLFYGLWPYVTIEIDIEGAERILKEEYQLAKVQAIVNFKKSQETKENE